MSLKDNSNEIKRLMEDAISKGMNEIGKTCAEKAKKNIWEAPRVRTGRMYISVRHNQPTVSGEKITVEIGTDAKDPKTNEKYPIYHELGTQKIKPIHFLSRASQENTAEYKNILKTSLKSG